MNKQVRVILLDEAEVEYRKLNELVGEQLKKGLENSEEAQLLKSIKQKIEFIINSIKIKSKEETTHITCL